MGRLLLHEIDTENTSPLYLRQEKIKLLFCQWLFQDLWYGKQKCKAVLMRNF